MTVLFRWGKWQQDCWVYSKPILHYTVIPDNPPKFYTRIERKFRMPQIRGIKDEAVIVYCDPNPETATPQFISGVNMKSIPFWNWCREQGKMLLQCERWVQFDASFIRHYTIFVIYIIKLTVENWVKTRLFLFSLNGFKAGWCLKKKKRCYGFLLHWHACFFCPAAFLRQHTTSQKGR